MCNGLQVWVKRRTKRPEDSQRYPHLADLEAYNMSACSRSALLSQPP